MTALNPTKKEQRIKELDEKLRPLKLNQKQRLSEDEAIVLLLRRGADKGRHPAVREGIRL